MKKIDTSEKLSRNDIRFRIGVLEQKIQELQEEKSCLKNQIDSLVPKLPCSQNCFLHEDENVFIQRIQKTIDYELENMITQVYEFHINKTSISEEHDWKIFEKYVNIFYNID